MSASVAFARRGAMYYDLAPQVELYPNIASDPVGTLQYGTGFALNPNSGSMEQVYAVAPLDPLEANYTDYRFASDGLSSQHVSLAGFSPGFHSDNSGTWSNFMERAVLGGLLAIGGVAAGSVASGAAAGGASEGVAATTAAEGVDASTGLYAGESATAGTSTYGTVGGAATGAGGAVITGEQVTTAGKVLGTLKSLLSLSQANKIPEPEKWPGQADVGVESAPWRLTTNGDATPGSIRQAQSLSLILPLALAAVVLLLIFLKGR